jgi:broad specificity phosphatase PhoE
VTVEIVLVRHGQTEWSLSGQHTSTTDIPLTEAGREQARGLAERLAERSFALVVSSPYIRARETCELAGLADRVEIVPELGEWKYGEYEGITTPQIREQRPGWWLWRDGCPGGESPEEVGARADRVLARLREADGDVAAFGHGHIFRVLAARWVRQPVEFGGRLKLSAGSLSSLGFEREVEVITRWNDVDE